MMNYGYYIAAILLLVMLVFLSISRPNKKRLVLRLIASLIVVFGLLVLVIPILPSNTIENGESVILLTEGFQKDSVENYIKKIGKQPKQISIEDYSNTKNLHAATIHLFGYGLKDTTASFLQNSKLYFHPSALPSGISHIRWTKNILLGHPFSLQATMVNAGKKPLKLVLQSSQRNIDSVNVQPNKNVGIQLSSIPKNLGKGLYQLVVMDGKDLISNEIIPFVVKEPEPISILVLGDAPNFENKFLKNWLTDNGYSIAARTRISKQAFEQSFSNRKPTALDKITTALLNQFQVVVADESTILSLPFTERAALENQIHDKAIGLIIQSDTILKSPSIIASALILKPINGNIPFTAGLHFKRMDSSWHPSLNTNMYLEKGSDQAIQSLVLDQLGRLLVGVSKWKNGNIVSSALNNSYSWMLSGNKEVYGKYWSHLIETALAPTEQLENWEIATDIPRVGEPITIRLEKNDSNPPTAIIDGEEVFLKQNANQPFIMNGCYWPTHAGWHNISSSNGESKDWFVFDHQQWKTLVAKERMLQTAQFIEQAKLSNTVTSNQEIENFELIPKFWAMLILLIGLAVLWVEAKLD
jgi:hypothetical protein